MKKIISTFLLISGFALFSEHANAQDEEESFRPKNKNFGFNIGVNLSSRSEQLEALYFSENSETPGMFRGLDLSFRYYISDRVAYRTNISFFNSSHKHDTGFNTSITGLSEISWNNGLMLVFKGTEKLEPYGFLDFGLGWTHSRENDLNRNRTEVERSLLFRTTNIKAGLGFNYYFAKNIGIGAELGTGLNVLTIPQENRIKNDHLTQFLSGVGGKMGVTVIF